MRILCFAFALVGLATASRVSFVVTPSYSECFHLDVLDKSQFFISAVVSTGGRLDASFTVTDPEGGLVYHDPHASSLRLVARARIPGQYTVCLSHDSALSPEKQIILHFESESERNERLRPHGTIALGTGGRSDVHDSLRWALMRVMETTSSLNDEFTITRARHAAHLALVENATSVLNFTGFLLTFMVIVFGAAQVFYLWRRIISRTTRVRA